MSKLKLVFWDVQHGSASYIKTPNGQHLVIDLRTGDHTKHSSSFNPLLQLRDHHGVSIRLFGSLAQTTVVQVLGKHLLRSGTSAGANCRVAHRGRSKAEFIAKCGDSLRELEESAYWLELLEEAEIVPVTTKTKAAKKGLVFYSFYSLGLVFYSLPLTSCDFIGLRR